MPTGYTAALGDGRITEFRDFAMQCARAFGALITMRDDAFDAPIPDVIEPSNYSRDAAKRAEDELNAFMAMSDEEVAAAADAAYAKAVKYDADFHAKQNAENACYEAMRQKVWAWTPPTDDHKELKSFMLQQIEISISNFKGSGAPDRNDYAPETWKAAHRAELLRSLTYHQKEYAKELERVADRTEWIRALRASLNVAA